MNISGDYEYDINYGIADIPHNRCVIHVHFNKRQYNTFKFLIRLMYNEDLQQYSETEIARFDHNPSNQSGHDVYDEGLHVDVKVNKGNGEVKLHPPHGPLPPRGALIDKCIRYLIRHDQWFVGVYEGTIPPSKTPRLD